MRALGLRARAAKTFKATTQSKHNLPVAPNRLEQDFTAAAANRKWVSDITDLWTEAGWLYLAVVLDLYSRAVVGFGVRRADDAGSGHRRLDDGRLAAPAGTRARRAFRPGQPIRLGGLPGGLGNPRLLVQRAKKGDCYDNAAMESFFHSLKVEQVNGCRYQTREEAKADVFEYIETYYNPIRRHSTLDYLSPRDFENRKAA
jgi:transposase InsO family protein